MYFFPCRLDSRVCLCGWLWGRQCQIAVCVCVSVAVLHKISIFVCEYSTLGGGCVSLLMVGIQELEIKKTEKKESICWKTWRDIQEDMCTRGLFLKSFDSIWALSFDKGSTFVLNCLFNFVVFVAGLYFLFGFYSHCWITFSGFCFFSPHSVPALILLCHPLTFVLVFFSFLILVKFW